MGGHASPIHEHFIFYITLFSFSHSFMANIFIKGVPIDYCFARLNKSDCHLPAVPVFTYYKEGSRCEIEFWRGCPTYNMFEDQYQCSHVCIGRLGIGVQMYDDVNDNIIIEEDICTASIDLDDCSTPAIEKYTYNNTEKKCVKVLWKGCFTKNMFEDEKSCNNKCQAEDIWEGAIEHLNKGDVEKLEHILDDIDNTSIKTLHGAVETIENNNEVTTATTIVTEQVTEAVTVHVTEPHLEDETTVEPTEAQEPPAPDYNGAGGEDPEHADVPEETPASIETTAKPVETTAEPVETTAEPIVTTAEPVETTAEPVETTAEPVEITEEPVEITVEPVVTTAEPTHEPEVTTVQTSRSTGILNEVDVAYD